MPWYVGDLDHSEILDLSDNGFTGEVPYALTKMENLKLLLLSDNELFLVLFPYFKTGLLLLFLGITSLEMTPLGTKTKGQPKLLLTNRQFCS